MSDSSNPRIDALESRVARLEEMLAESTAVSASSLVTPLSPRPATLSPPPPLPGAQPVPMSSSTAPETRAPRELNLDSEVVLKWGGVALVVLAVGFAVSTAISEGWVGPEFQLVGAVALSLVLIGVGLRLRLTRLPWSFALCSGGVAALLTTVASSLFIDQTSTDVAFTAIAVVGLGGFVLARMVPSEWVGLVTVMGGVIAWLVVGEAEPPFAATAAGLAVLLAIAIAVALERHWFGLRLLIQVVGLGGLVWLGAVADTGAEQVWTLVIASAVTMSLLWVPSIGELESLWQQLEVQLSAAVSPWAVLVLGLTFEMDTDTAIGSTELVSAAAMAVLAIRLRAMIRSPHFVSLMLGASVSLTIGLAVLLSAEATFVAVAVQGAGLIMVSKRMGESVRVLINAAVLLIAAAVFVLVDGVNAWTDDTAYGPDIARLAIIVAIGFGLWLTRRRPTQQVGALGLLGLLLIWLGSVFVHLPEGQAVVSVSWAILGTVVLIAGAVRKIPEVATVGLAVLALTVTKLLIVDMQEVDTLWRAALFLAVGLGLMRLGFLLSRLTAVDDGDAYSSE
ncbi:MAG: DUF2339 domain-containing protein [Acidimicrobiaceae bacterium]|nr:DUF2339 domain-containing protein [Acidimicrobiaceae bacterium]MBT5851883.1 DUF2339 domain-containing protein [Acidimicrobiaceae bacterium]